MRVNITFIAVILIAGVLRLIGLDQFPAGLNADEASIGYNAYSLLQTGKDEYGTPSPLTFKSFGDYKPGLYFYLVMPFVKILGLNEWAVRIPSALLGIGTVVLIYFLGKEIFKNKWIGVLSALLLAITPMSIHFSRGSWESNAATFFITLGVFLFIKGNKFLGWSMISFLASMYTYQSPRLIIPILLIFLLVLYRKEFTSMILRFHSGQVRIIRIRGTVLGVALLIILTIPLILQFTSGAGNTRFSGLSFFSDSGPSSRVNELRGEHETPGSIFSKFIHNKITSYGPSFLGHYLDHFRGDFLFISGDPLIRNKVPGVGQFYIIEAFFLIIGLVYLIKQRQIHRKLLIAWILVAPLASSITFQTPHALRSLSMVVPLTLVMGYGINELVKSFKSMVSITIIIIITIILFFESVHYLESYYIHYPKRYPLAWEYGFKEMVLKLGKYEDQYENVIITDRYDQPYILVLFYKKYDPAKYQPQAVLSHRDKFNFGTVRGFDKYKFHSIAKDELEAGKNTLFIGTEQEIPQNANVIDKIFFPNGEVAFVFTGT